MTYLSLEETKQISLNCLIFVDKFCKEHNLKYSIAYGTLLGAIRHKGFIPWDDDIDIVMMREDYEKFLDCFEKNNTDKNFSLFSFEKGTYYFPFSKIVDTSTRTKTNFLPLEGLGIGIDIFPYDGVGNTVKTYEKLKKKARFIARLNQYAVMKKDYKFSGLSKIIKVPMFYYAKLKGLKHWRYKIEKVTTTYSNQDCKYVDYVADLESLPTEKESFDELTDLEFEGYMFKGPVRYNDCLTNWYGSYMELPPEDQRQPHAQKAWRVKK